MRLLHHDSEGRLMLTDDFVNEYDLPPYAILSHTWVDGQEVTLQDLKAGTGRDKSGYTKIHYCGQQARRHGLEYFWVDTCCIDKSNNAEFQHAIKSMFRWYQNASRCYAYLSDVSTLKRKAVETDGASELSWYPAFRMSRWFTRGWTLQELLAPSVLEFYAGDWTPLGDKASLQQQIHEVTAIPQSALQGAPLFEFSTEARLQWGQSRQTKLEEDKAYSLVGFFGVDLAPVYGIGYTEAFRRLQDEINKTEECLRDLHLTDPRDDKRRIEDTKGGLLADVSQWVLDTSEYQEWFKGDHDQLLWIRGDPGKGKTMLVCSIANSLRDMNKSTDILAYFFCQATDTRINNAVAVLRGLLYMILEQQPSLMSHVRKRYNRAGRKIFEDSNAWFLLTDILIDVLKDPLLQTTYLLIDALDECDRDLPKLLQFITQSSSLSPRVKWIISSRNLPEIHNGLAAAEQKIGLSLELNAQSITTAVDSFIQHKISQLADKQRYDDHTRLSVLEYVSSNAQDTFLWVALIFQTLRDVPKRHAIASLKAIPAGLDALYERMLHQISSSLDAALCKQILAIAATVYRPVTIHELSTLVEVESEIDAEDLIEIVDLCGSFLRLRDDTVYFVHQSAVDFITTTASRTILPSELRAVHRIILSRSLQAMSPLHQDMYDLVDPGYPACDVVPPYSDPLLTLRYSCIYWVDHLCELDSSGDTDCELLTDGGIVDTFLRQKYIYWLESLSLCRSVPKGVTSMTSLANLVQGKSSAPMLSELVYDAKRFVLYHKHAIETWPLQTYVSALLFSPTQSLIRRLFQNDLPSWVTSVRDREPQWTSCLQVLEGHTQPVVSVMFSKDSSLLLSTTQGTTMIFDTASGHCLYAIEHIDYALASTFSHDSSKVATVLSNFQIHLFDTTDGTHLYTLVWPEVPRTYRRYVYLSLSLIAFSCDSLLVAVTHYDMIAVWNTSTCECLQVFEGRDGKLISIAFTPEAKQLLSAAENGTINVWDVPSGNCLRTLAGDERLDCGTFSSDLKQFTSSSSAGTVTRNITSGEYLKLSDSSGSYLTASPDSTKYATQDRPGQVSIWEADTGIELQTLECRMQVVTSIAFSHDSKWIASGANTGEVKIWDLSIGKAYSTRSDYASNRVVSLCWSPNGLQPAELSGNASVDMWDVSSRRLSEPEGHWDQVRCVGFSPNRPTQLASGSSDNTIKLWNSSTGECEQQLVGHQSSISSIAFSQDSTRLVSSALDATVRIWDLKTSSCVQTVDFGKREHHSSHDLLAVFPLDSRKLVIAFRRGLVRLWDLDKNVYIRDFPNVYGYVAGEKTSLALSNDSVHLAAATKLFHVMIWNACNGRCILQVRCDRPVSRMSFDITGQYLNTSIGTIDIKASLARHRNSVTRISSPIYHGLSLHSSCSMVTYNSCMLVWLPSEYRTPYCNFDVLGDAVAIVDYSGRLWMYKFDLDQIRALNLGKQRPPTA